MGLPQFAPFDKIIVTAAAPNIVQNLLQQLKIGGIMVVPAGEKEVQTMVKIIKVGENNFQYQNFGECKFVPLLGKNGWNL